MKKSRILSAMISIALLASSAGTAIPVSAAPEENSDSAAVSTVSADENEVELAEASTYDFTAMASVPEYSSENKSGFVTLTSSVGSKTTSKGKEDTDAGSGRTAVLPTVNSGMTTSDAAGIVYRVDVPKGAYKISVKFAEGAANAAVAVSGMEASRLTGTGTWDNAKLVKKISPAKWEGTTWSYEYASGEDFIEIEAEPKGSDPITIESISIEAVEKTNSDSDKPTVFVLGDSTQKTYTFEENSMSGYGQVLAQMFDLSKVNVVNYSMGGRSMRANYQEGRFNDVLLAAKPGDYIFIHSAHNDESADENARFGRGTSTGMYRDFLYNLYIPAMKAQGVTPVLVTSMPRTNNGKYSESSSKPNGFSPDAPGIMREAAQNDSDVKLIDLYDGAKKYIDEIGNVETTYIYQSLEAGESAGKTNSGSYANGHPDNKIDGTHYKEAAAKQWARIIAQDIYNQSSDEKLGKLADALSDGVKAACADGNWIDNVFPEMAEDVSTVGGQSQGDNAYYRNQIEKMLQLGIMAKDSDGNFKPKAEMTVGSFAKSLTKAWSLDESVLSDYTSDIEKPSETDKPNETEKPSETDEPTNKPTDKPSETNGPTNKPTEKPSETDEPTNKPTDEPKTVDAVKAVVKYDSDGRLTGIEIDKNYKYNGTVENVSDAKVFVWNNLDEMKPLCNAVTSESAANLEADGDVTSWTVSAGDSGAKAGTELMPGLTMLFTDSGAGAGAYLTTASDNGKFDSATGTISGTAMKYTASKTGVLTVNFTSVGETKEVIIVSEGTKDKTAAEFYAKGVTKASAAVEAGKTYYISVLGSKGRFVSAEFVEGTPATPTPKPTQDPNATPEPAVVEKTAIDKDAALTREAMAAIIYDAYEAKFGKDADGSWIKPVYMTKYNGTNLSPDDPNYDPNLTGASAQYYPLVGWGALTDVNDFHTSLYGKAKEVYNLGLMRSEKGIERGKMADGTEMEPLTVVTREKAAKELFFLYGLVQDKDTENQVLPEGNMAFTLTEDVAVPDASEPSYPNGDKPSETDKPDATVKPTDKPSETDKPDATEEPTEKPNETTKPGELPADEAWTSNDSALMAAATAAGDKAAFGPVNGISGYGNWVEHSINAEYTHTNGQKYTFTSAFQAGSGNAERRSFSFTPKQACIVTVAYAAASGRPVYIYQGKNLLASGEEGLSNGQAATITADVEDPSAGNVVVYGGSSNKDIFGIFADYYDPDVIVNRKLSGNISYSGTETGLKVLFKDKKDGTEYTVNAVNGAYSVELRQNRDYDISVIDSEGKASEKVAVTMDTNSVSLAKMDKTQDINLVDIAMMNVTGDVVVHEVNNDDTSLDLSKVQLTFTAKDDASYTYTTGITDNKLSLDLMPNHEYAVTALNIDGYSLSQLSGSYVMAAGDMTPFKNILITENVSDVEFKSEIHVGADKEYTRINDAITAIKAMKDRPAGEAGRVTVLIDPGTYIEQVIVDSSYVTLKAADEANKPEVQWYYGVGYLYYSSAGTQYYSEDWAVQKTKKGPVTRWGTACRIVGQYCNLEGIVFRNTLNCEVTAAELADGSAPALNNEYSDVNGKPDRTVQGYDARSKAATERAAAIALDGGYTELYRCEFISSQDTFYTNKTAYAKECYIEGATDYIYGGNSMLFEDCTLAWHGYSDQSVGGYITACKTSGPSNGTPNEGTNGYMFKNSTVTNSKYYPNNKFAPGSWGRNWGGTDCQVVFDGVKMDGVELPGAWVKMGGELSASILYVNDVTDKNGNKVDTTGTVYNPNGTMETNGYTMMADTDYFGGTWVPAHYDKVIELDEYTSTWYFGKSNGAAEYALEGTGGEADITATSNNPTAQVLHVNALNGKFNNAKRTDEWAQINAGTILTVPVVTGSVIKLSMYSRNLTAEINGETFECDKEYTYTGTESTVDIKITNGDYISSITVVSPAK